MQKKNKKFKTRQERGLGKYDAPLSLHSIKVLVHLKEKN